MSRLRIEPVTVKAARALVQQWHRHLPEIQGGLFAAAVSADGVVVGVAIAANPARVWQGTGRIVIARVATTGEKNACSMLYGAICRAAAALGYREAWTYTLPDEPGDSLRAAGFREQGWSNGGDHGRKKRPRRPAVRPEPKRRWMRVLQA
jgi:SLT domain-containing protein